MRFVNFLFEVKLKYYYGTLNKKILKNKYFLKKQKKLFFKIYINFLKNHNIKITNEIISIIALLYVATDDQIKGNNYLKIQNFAYRFGPKISYSMIGIYENKKLFSEVKDYLPNKDYLEENSSLNSKLKIGIKLFEILAILNKSTDKMELYKSTGELLAFHLFAEIETMNYFYLQNKSNSKKTNKIDFINSVGFEEFIHIKRYLYDKLLKNIKKIELDFNYIIILINKYSR